MTVEEIANTEEYRSLVEKYRWMCLWSFPEDILPKTKREMSLVLDAFENYGDMNAYRKAGEIRKWLSQSSSLAS